MTWLARGAGFAAITAAGLLVAGCGSAAAPAPHVRAPARPLAVPLDTSVATAAGIWAAVLMGGSAAQHNDFWQLVVRPAGSARWKLVTPPGTADNGGLVLAPGARRSAVAAIRPSQYLTYTPLIHTSDSGKAWSALGPLDAAMAGTPGSLAMQPRTGQLLALTGRGTVEQARPGAARWATLATARALSATLAGRQCGLRALTAVAYAPSAAPLLAGQCARPGVAGIFANINGSWQAAGPVVAASLAGQNLTVLRLAVTGRSVTTLIQAGSGRGARLLAAWSRTGTSGWATSVPLPLGSAALASASFGPAGTVAVTTTGARGATITRGGRWHTLPALPPGTAALAPGTGGAADALAARGSTLTVWRLSAGGAVWTPTQVINVPIQYGSSA